MKQVKVIRTDKDGAERIIGISDRLANNAAYMHKHNLRLVPALSEPAVNPTPPVAEIEVDVVTPEFKEEIKDIREDVLSMGVEELQEKYERDDWVSLAKSLSLKGNHSNTGEVKLITKIKAKLTE